MFRSRTNIKMLVFTICLIFAATGRAESQEVPASVTDAGVAREVDAAEVAFITALTAVDIPRSDQVLTDDYVDPHQRRRRGEERISKLVGGQRAALRANRISAADRATVLLNGRDRQGDPGGLHQVDLNPLSAANLDHQ